MTTAARPNVPDVVIGGAPRSGTTFLCELLAKHPQVFVARPFIPEPKVLMTPHPAGDAGLLSRYETYFGGAPASSLRVEKTSYYLENAEARERFARLLPEARIIFILREPVQRAYSNWLWSTRNGLESLPFREAVSGGRERANPLPPERSYARPFDYLTRGLYGTHAEAWIRAIGRERIAFYLIEDAIAEPEHFVADLQSFVGVEPLAWQELATGIVNANDLRLGDLDAAFAAELRAQFAPEMRRLVELTGLSLARWGYPD